MASYKISIEPLTWWGSLRQRDYLESLSVDGRMKLKEIFKKWNSVNELDWSDSMYGQVANNFECGDEHRAHKMRGFFLTRWEPVSFSRRTPFLLLKYNVGCRFNSFCSPAPRNWSTECEIEDAFLLGTSALQCVRSAIQLAYNVYFKEIFEENSWQQGSAVVLFHQRNFANKSLSSGTETNVFVLDQPSGAGQRL